MIELSTGDKVEHSIYGNVELYGFVSVSDQIEINEVDKENETILDVVNSVNGDQVEFLDDDGHKHVEPLKTFYEHADI